MQKEIITTELPKESTIIGTKVTKQITIDEVFSARLSRYFICEKEEI